MLCLDGTSLTVVLALELCQYCPNLLTTRVIGTVQVLLRFLSFNPRTVGIMSVQQGFEAPYCIFYAADWRHVYKEHFELDPQTWSYPCLKAN